jgi:hypothetical protein
MSRAAGPWGPNSSESIRRMWSSWVRTVPNRLSIRCCTAASNSLVRQMVRMTLAASVCRPVACRAEARAMAPSAVLGIAPPNHATTAVALMPEVSITRSAADCRAFWRGQPARSRRALSSSMKLSDCGAASTSTHWAIRRAIGSESELIAALIRPASPARPASRICVSVAESESLRRWRTAVGGVFTE